MLIPIGYARLERDRDCVMVDGLASSDVAGLPEYGQGPLTRDFETSVRESFTARRGTMTSGGRASEGLAGGSGMMDTAGLDNTPSTGTGPGMTGTGGLSDTDSGMRASTPTPDSMHSTGSSAGMMAFADDGLRGGERSGAGSQGPAGGMSAASGGMGALNERADEPGYDRDAVEMRGDASHRSGLAGSDYQHNADEDFYASDAFDDARFYGSRRPGGLSNRGNFGLSGGAGGAADVDPLSGSGLQRDGSTLHGSSTGDTGTDRDETSRLARAMGDIGRVAHLAMGRVHARRVQRGARFRPGRVDRRIRHGDAVLRPSRGAAGRRRRSRGGRPHAPCTRAARGADPGCRR